MGTFAKTKKPPRLAPYVAIHPSTGGEFGYAGKFPSCGGVASQRDDGVVSLYTNVLMSSEYPIDGYAPLGRGNTILCSHVLEHFPKIEKIKGTPKNRFPFSV